MRRIFREPFLKERVLELSKELLGKGDSSRRALLRPHVLTTARGKIQFHKILYLKFFVELFAKSLPPEARVLPDKSQFG